MIYIDIAGLIVSIDNRFADIERLCRAYITAPAAPHISVRVTDAELAREAEASGGHCGGGYLETVCAYRSICLRLPEFGVFLLHASVLELDGRGYALLGPSGVGKTTQTRLWLELFPGRARVINGDKPLIRREGRDFFACGTPWQGKEGLGTNARVPLRALCFLEQARENSIRPLESGEYAERLLRQCLLPTEPGALGLFLGLCDGLVSSVPAFRLACLPEASAAELTYETLRGA